MIAFACSVCTCLPVWIRLIWCILKITFPLPAVFVYKRDHENDIQLSTSKRDNTESCSNWQKNDDVEWCWCPPAMSNLGENCTKLPDAASICRSFRIFFSSSRELRGGCVERWREIEEKNWSQPITGLISGWKRMWICSARKSAIVFKEKITKNH